MTYLPLVCLDISPVECTPRSVGLRLAKLHSSLLLYSPRTSTLVYRRLLTDLPPKFRFIFSIVFFLNLFLVFAGSSGAVPFGTILLIVVLWYGISAPLTAIGFFYGTRQGVGCARSNLLYIG